MIDYVRIHCVSDVDLHSWVYFAIDNTKEDLVPYPFKDHEETASYYIMNPVYPYSHIYLNIDDFNNICLALKRLGYQVQVQNENG